MPRRRFFVGYMSRPGPAKSILLWKQGECQELESTDGLDAEYVQAASSPGVGTDFILCTSPTFN